MEEKQPFETPPEGNELTRTARRKIDDEINELKRKIQFLGTKRNKLSPISVLPPEILSNIFILNRDSHSSFYFQTPNHHAPWIQVGHVCRHWREVALSYPSFWSVPVFTAKPELAQEMIQRSKMAPLTIRLTTTPENWALGTFEQLENALAQISRIQSIKLALEDNIEHTGIYSPLSQPAPLLENASFSCFSNTNPFSFPRDALLDAPRLQSIDFFRLYFSWESAIFQHRNLSDLRLWNIDVAMDDTIGQMMDALHHLPNLRILTLFNSIPSHTTSNGNEKTPELKFLEQLEMRADAMDCIFLLRHIQYPSHATVRLHSFSTSVEDSTTIFSLISQNLHRTQSVEAGIPQSPVVIRSARLLSADLDPVEIAFFNRADSVEDRYLQGGGFNPFIQIRLSGGSNLSEGHASFPQARSRLFISVCNCFNLSSLTGLFLDWNLTNDHIGAIQDSFGQLPKLKIIHISRFLPEICLAIAGSGTPNNQTGHPLQGGGSQPSFPPVTFFPALRTVVVQGADFRPYQHPNIMEHLTSMLMERSNTNAPIDRLSLEQCYGLQTWQKRRLEELVVHLVGGEVIDARDSNSGDDWNDDEDEDGSEYFDDGGGLNYLDRLGSILF